MNGVCCSPDGINPTLTTNKGEGNRIAIPVNPMPDGTCRTLKYQYQKNSSANFNNKGSRGATAVAIPVITPERANKRQNGRRFKEDGEESFTLTAQDIHGVAIGIDDLYANRQPRFYDDVAPTMRSDRQGLKVAVDIEPIQVSGDKVSESDDVAHALNCSDQRKIFGANQKRTMVGYNATLKSGGGV